MRAQLQVSYLDVDPGSLRWGLGLPQQPALAVLDIAVRSLRVQARLLGASHQVIVRGRGFICSETVACGVDRAAPLPARAAHPVRGSTAWYRLASEVLTFDSREIHEYTAQLDHDLGERRDALVGVFPAPTSAITAVLVEPTNTGVRWHTWHAYPDCAKVVATAASVDFG